MPWCEHSSLPIAQSTTLLNSFTLAMLAFFYWIESNQEAVATLLTTGGPFHLAWDTNFCTQWFLSSTLLVCLVRTGTAQKVEAHYPLPFAWTFHLTLCSRVANTVSMCQFLRQGFSSERLFCISFTPSWRVADAVLYCTYFSTRIHQCNIFWSTYTCYNESKLYSVTSYSSLASY